MFSASPWQRNKIFLPRVILLIKLIHCDCFCWAKFSLLLDNTKQCYILRCWTIACASYSQSVNTYELITIRLFNSVLRNSPSYDSIWGVIQHCGNEASVIDFQSRWLRHSFINGKMDRFKWWWGHLLCHQMTNQPIWLQMQLWIHSVGFLRPTYPV